MRVVLIHRYFWPDSAPYANILRLLAARLGDDGHDVQVLTCQPSYRSPGPQRAPGREPLGSRVMVRRWRVLPDRRSTTAKMVNLVLFCARLLTMGFRLGKADVVMAASTPPVAVAWVGSWLARRSEARFVYHKQDIYPDVAVAAGLLRSAWLATLLRRVDARTERRADRVVVLSRDMAATVRDRGVEKDRIVTINNFDPWTCGGPAAEPPQGPTARAGGPLRVAFAGTLGRFQNIETIIAAMVILRDDPTIAFHFFGDGPLRAPLERQVATRGLTNTRLYGYRPPQEVADFLRTQADLGIVSLLPGVIRAAYPSRTMSYLRQGCPVLALVDGNSELAEMLVGSGAGIQVEPVGADRLAETIQRLARKPGDLLAARSRAAALYHARFDVNQQLDRWTELFDQLAERHPVAAGRSAT